MKSRSTILTTLAALAALAAFGGKEDWDARYAAWEARVKAYAPDLSDSSKHLEPPATGRIARPIRIVENGRPKAEIVVDLSDAILIDEFFTDKAKWTIALKMARGHEIDVARTAAQTLQKTLADITGAELPVVQKATDEKNVKIYLGASFAKGKFDDDLKVLASRDRVTDGFAVRVGDGDIYIFGARPAGTLFGVEAFIENNTDLIWAFPDEDGTVFTPTPTVDVVWADAREIPALFARGIGGGEKVAAWKMHNRINFSAKADHGGFSYPGGHYFCPQYYDCSAGIQKFNSGNASGYRPRPWSEYKSKLCLSNPELLRHQLERVPNLATLRYGAPHLCVFGMDDNPNVCACPECRKPIQALDGRMLTPEKDSEIFWSAQFYQYLNKIDDAIQAKYPGYATSTFAYYYARHFPPVKVNKTIVPYFCAYWRGAYHLPVFAPLIYVWGWPQLYEEWSAHTPELTMYDYWGLCLEGQPYAEIYQEDLRYQRAIGFLATGSEGFMRGDDLGTADERWCMARLMWNVDADVEQLHRRFNRRAYREAAPHFDRIRGAVRQAYYAVRIENLKKAIGTNETVKATVIAEIAAAEKAAVTNPRAKILVDRSVRAWRVFYGIPVPAAARPPQNPAPKKTRRPALEVAKEVGEEKFIDDRWNSRDERLYVLCMTLRTRIQKGELSGDAALRYLREHLDDTVARAVGVSALMRGQTMRDWMPSFVRSFTAKGRTDDAIAFGFGWAKWDGEATPFDIQFERLSVLRAIVKRDPPGWREFVTRGTTEGNTPGVRGNCALAVLELDKERLASPESQQRLLAVLMDEFMDNKVRLAAAKRLPDVFRKDGRADAEAVSERLLAAFASGDWSNLARACYSHAFHDDMMLDALVAVCERLLEEEQAEAARKLFTAGIKALRYDCPIDKTVEREKPYYYGGKAKGYEKKVAEKVKLRYDQIEKLRAKLFPST